MLSKTHIDILADVAQFIVGGLMTLAASKLSVAYGPSTGALVWIFPILLYVSAVALSFQGHGRALIANLCFASFGTTIVNAFTGVILGMLVLFLPGNIIWAVLASIVTSVLIGYGYHRLF